MRESLDHRSPGWIRQSRKCCTQFIHNHMVVDFLSMSSVNFAIPRFCSLISDLINLTIQVHTATCAEARAGRIEGLASGAGGWGLPLECVLDVSLALLQIESGLVSAKATGHRGDHTAG
jgi:hypothetical protein